MKRLPAIPAILWFVVVLSVMSVPAFAGDVELTWDHSTSTTVTGYNVYWGLASGAYTSHVAIPYQNTYILTGLQPNTYYIAVTAFDQYGNESGYSNEVRVVVTGPIQPPGGLTIRKVIVAMLKVVSGFFG